MVGDRSPSGLNCTCSRLHATLVRENTACWRYSILLRGSLRLKQHSFRRRPLGDDWVATISIVDECLLFNDQLMTDEWPLFDRLTEFKILSLGDATYVIASESIRVYTVAPRYTWLPLRWMNGVMHAWRIYMTLGWPSHINTCTWRGLSHGFFQYRIIRCYGFVWVSSLGDI